MSMKCDDPRCCPACSEAWREKLNEETKVAMIAWIDKKSDELMNQPEE